MTNSEKLARWQGWEPHDRGGWCSTNQRWSKSYPDYLNDDSAAMSLLDTLVEKGYCVDIKFTGATVYWWTCEVYKNSKSIVWICRRNTRREAVVAACLELIGKEDV